MQPYCRGLFYYYYDYYYEYDDDDDDDDDYYYIYIYIYIYMFFFLFFFVFVFFFTFYEAEMLKQPTTEGSKNGKLREKNNFPCSCFMVRANTT